ncbi:Uracil-DNA glycosylase [Cryptosporidium felis]|nr:Uracil-DNA glycosylase [Cryptosporidium felis]
MTQLTIHSYFGKRGVDETSSGSKKCESDIEDGSQLGNKKFCNIKMNKTLASEYETSNKEYYPSEAELRNYFGDEWFEILKAEFLEPYFVRCMKKVRERRKVCKVYPPEEKMFSSFFATPINKISVVILGQDPYHQPGQAMGLSFSVPKGIPIPPSLRNIFKEIGKETPKHGDLTSWANQGVFLLNSLLSVEEGKPMSHKEFGWERFTSAVISKINDLERPIVFMLWGKHAQSKASAVCRRRHLVLESGHPSPLSQKKFIGCNHFNKCNDFLRKIQRREIDWTQK